MQKRTVRWLAALAVALMVGMGALLSGTQTKVAYGADTPTATPSQTDGHPSGSGGGH